jgi:hypothetical protein
MQNAIFTAGVSYSKVRSIHFSKNDDLLLYKLGFTYVTPRLVSKTMFSHNKTLLDLMYIESSYYVDNKYTIKPSQADVFLEDIIYTLDSHKFEIVLSHMVKKNMFAINRMGKISNLKGNTKGYGAVFRDTFRYRDNDKLFLEFSINTRKNDNQPEMIWRRGVLRNLNTYKKFDIFNEIVYYRDSKENKNYYDYSAGVIYHHNEDLSFSIKGQNIFNKAKTTDFVLVDPNTFQRDAVVKVPSIEQRFMISMEYLF